jgi:hypothetical protein
VPVASIAEVRVALDARRAVGGPIRLEVDRDGRRSELAVEPGVDFPIASFLITAVVALCWLLIGPLAVLKRPGYLRARLLNLLAVSVAAEIALPGGWLWPTTYLVATILLAGFQSAVELHLASVIPERQAWLDRRRWAIRAYYVLGIGSTAVAALLIVAAAHAPPGTLPFTDLDVFQRFTFVMFPLWALGVVFLLGRQALTYPEAKGRQQAALVLAGSIPWVLVLVANELGLILAWVPARWESTVWNLALLCYPLAVLAILWREAADQERILLELTEKVKTVGSVGEISKVVSLDLHAAFHPKSTHVFYRERHSRDLTLGHSTGMMLREEQIPERSPLLRLVEAYGKAVDYPEDLAGLPPGERAWLDRLEARLLVPLNGADGTLLGLLVLGEKKSEEPYTPRDRRLLQALSAQIALVYENARLKDRVQQSQTVQREVLAQLAGRELELVKECPRCGRCYDAGDERCAEDGATLGYTLPVERTIGRRYRLERLLDRGGMGAIYRAVDLHLARPVAVKVLNAGVVGEEGARRFASEARLTANLHHPNVVTVYDYGTTDTGAPFLVMELLEGFTLRQALDRRGTLPPLEAAEWLGQACEGVSSAHRAGIIHRDLKPANLFVAEHEGVASVVKILDFGIAKVKSAALRGAAGLTAPGALIGTFSYMAPEQLERGEVDERSDVFSLGVIAVEALTGRRPYPGETPGEILGAMFRGEYRFAGESAAERELAAVVRRCLARDPAERFASVAALQEALLPAIRRLAEAPAWPPRAASAGGG